jgi:hypothetical protein
MVRNGIPPRLTATDPVFLAASRHEGLLLTGSNLGLVQLRTRRPVLLDGHGLDALPYALGTATEMERILREVYGVDLLDPPPEIKQQRPGALLPDTGKALWERRTPAEWHDIRRRFGVTQVMTYSDWQLQLSMVARSAEFALFDIP